MNRYPIWKYLILIAVVLVGGLYALPNLYGEDPAIQVSARSGDIDLAGQELVVQALKGAGIEMMSSRLEGNRLLIRFANTDIQLKAAEVVRERMGGNYITALNLAPATPDWLRAVDAEPMYLGLDLRGGVHFLMEVDMEAAVNQALEGYVGELRTLLRGEKIGYLTIQKEPDNLKIKYRNEEEREKSLSIIKSTFEGLDQAELDSDKGVFLRLSLKEQKIRDIRKQALKQNITTLRNRVNELGVAEPVIQQQGEERIVVQLPGVQDTTRAKEILGATATLEFRLVEEGSDAYEAKRTGRIPAGARLYSERNGNPILLKRRVMLTGDYITDAASGIEQQSGSPAVYITLDGKGAGRFSEATKDNIGKLMAVVFIESRSESKKINGETVKKKVRDAKVINVARIRDQLSKRFQITGLDSTTEARDLALLLRAGALAAPIEIVEERTVGPSLGKDNIDQGFASVVIGFAMVLVLMLFYYRAFGMVANMALTLNLVLIVAVLSMLQATLTLPGIAGIVLTVGMAVDANVLIFERIREELRLGNSPQASIHSGYAKALSTIADANITTLIAAIVLFSFGTGPIKGFAVTLSIGIVTSMFTAIFGTRAVINLMYGGRRVEKLSI
ncbi:protein-export membrane protein SecD [Solemya pervernicosa gill symbiont]|uniref:Protein translocase subunit SecD n=2 Tax=Gammaproteobacteria incertae sedis TaxID=118884 RepID=A0A1T2LAX6_9GAMM|nr:protein translocase subunit SecD [Candidatus Reidiella endopervernicosa]OOZ42241.1 protein-export membrane protein SecD [Solemya pervernicosa gill symbiont]QKQ28281.1 protein translocase subunit SecD [Candidatus Reidiella endopervernicosa]